MAQPKKLTFKEKQQKKLMDQLAPYIYELKQIKIGMKKNPDDMDTWRWASLETYKELAKLKDSAEVEKYREIALAMAREATLCFR
jgi:hypothetical protein